jgi:hypothetical protein
MCINPLLHVGEMTSQLRCSLLESSPCNCTESTATIPFLTRQVENAKWLKRKKKHGKTRALTGAEMAEARAWEDNCTRLIRIEMEKQEYGKTTARV